MSSRLIRLCGVVAVGTALLTGCRVDVTTTVTVDADGSGTVSLVAVADAELVDRVPDLAEQLRTDDLVESGWTVDGPEATDDGGLVVTITQGFDGPDEATALLAQINAGRGPYRDLTVTRTVSDEAVTIEVTGALGLEGGMRALADNDLIDVVGSVPWQDEVEQIPGGVAEAFGATLVVVVPDEDGDPGTPPDMADSDAGDLGHVWSVPVDGSVVDVSATRTIDVSSDARAPTTAIVAAVALMAWLVVSITFAVYVMTARRRRRT